MELLDAYIGKYELFDKASPRVWGHVSSLVRSN